MRRFISSSALAVLAVIIFAACNSNESKNTSQRSLGKTNSTATINPSNDGVRRITTVELRDAVNSGSAVIVDVRSDVDYQRNHIKGALHIPLDGFPARISELPHDKMIVTYCS